MVSIVCAYNNEKILESALKKSLEKQRDVDYEFFPVNTKELEFSSASETLNYAGRRVNGEYIFFVHQDVIFENELDLKYLYNLCCTNQFGIAGVAGCVNQDGKVKAISCIHHGKEHIRATENYDFNKPILADNLDECLLIIPKKVFEHYEFSDIGKTWHLYGADYSLKMKVHFHPVLIFPFDLWHLSEGNSLNSNYFDSIIELAKLYRKDFKEIVTLFGTWPTSPGILWLKCLYRKLRLYIKGK